MERSTLSGRSRKLFTLSAIHTGCSVLLDSAEYSNVEHASKVCIEFWDEIAKYIPEWGLVRSSRMTAGEIRRDFLHSHAIALQVFGIVGRDLVQSDRTNWKTRLAEIGKIDWSRSSADVWEGRALIGGRVSKSSNNVTLTANLIKNKLGLKLGPEEKRVEQMFERGRNNSNRA